MLNPNELRASIIRRGTSVAEIAPQIDMEKSTFYRKMNGSGSFTLAEIDAITELLGMSKEEMIHIFFTQYVADMRHDDPGEVTDENG